jgi:hypothetical protein
MLHEPVQSWQDIFYIQHTSSVPQCGDFLDSELLSSFFHLAASFYQKRKGRKGCGKHRDGQVSSSSVLSWFEPDFLPNSGSDSNESACDHPQNKISV